MKFITPFNTSILFRVALAFLFGYFGVSALVSPTTQAALWVNATMVGLIEQIVPIAVFMTVLGIAQVVVAVALLFGIFFRYALLLAALLLVGIIINLGWNEIALRDFVILTGVLYLYADESKVKSLQNRTS